MKKTLILLMGILMMLSGCGEKGSSSVVVQEFVGHDVQELYEWCGTIGDDYSCEISFENNSEYDKDIVFEQSIKAGKKLKEDIYFKVSNGQPQEIAVPYITEELTQSDIEVWKEAAGVKDLTYVYEASDAIAKNHVIRMEPDTHVTRETPIKVYISSGPAEPEKPEEPENTTIEITFGDYIGISVEEFEKKATELGLKPNHQKSRDKYNPDIKFGNIVWHGSGIYEKDEVFNYGVCINEIIVKPGEYIGKTENEFIKIAKDLHLTPTHLSNRDAYSAKVDKGNVVTHGNGTYVENEAFNYGLSYGPAVVRKGYEGGTEAVFLEYLDMLTLKGDGKNVYSDTVPAGKIISYNYGNYSTGDYVRYYVSLGEEQRYVDVPDFTGQDENELLKFLSSYGILVGARLEQESLIPKGKVCYNDHGRMKAGEKIAYAVSTGPATKETAIIEAFDTIYDHVTHKGDYEHAAYDMHRYLFGRCFTNYEIVPVYYLGAEPGVLLSITIDGEPLGDYPVNVPLDAYIVCRITSDISE